MKITDRQIELLKLLHSYKDEEVFWVSMAVDMTGWLTPSCVGGANGTHHSRTLRQLVRKGLVESSFRGSGKTLMFKITEQGIDLVDNSLS